MGNNPVNVITARELSRIGVSKAVEKVKEKLDPVQTAVFAARRIITECWGHHYRKGLDFRGSY